MVVMRLETPSTNGHSRMDVVRNARKKYAGLSLEQLRETNERLTLGMETALLESQLSFFDNFVDPREAIMFGKEIGVPIHIAGQHHTLDQEAFTSEMGLTEIRNEARRLLVSNEFAINASENRVSYLVGSGIKFSVHAKDPKASPPKAVIKRAQAAIDEFVEVNEFDELSQELVRRYDRDGEYFLRRFRQSDGITQVRTVEPQQIMAPPNKSDDPTVKFGIITEKGDAQQVIGYLINEGGIGHTEFEPVEADQIWHAKANVDRSSRRGLSTYYPIFPNLTRADKILRNMSMLVAVQAAIAAVRSHDTASKNQVQTFVDDQRDAQHTNASTGKVTRWQQLGMSEIWDIPRGQKVDFPSISINSAQIVGVLQAELRAIASRLVMPEYMLTADASGSNFASAMVAESPWVKFALRQQSTLVKKFVRIVRSVIKWQAMLGFLPFDILDQIVIKAEGPTMEVRDLLKEAKSRQILKRENVLSPETWSELEGLTYEREQDRFDDHSDRIQTRMPMDLGQPGTENPASKGDGDDEDDGPRKDSSAANFGG